jgi:folate-dependent phosphoribosylglycinamide formyltransferase PurN
VDDILADAPWNIAILTCGSLGFETALGIRNLSGIRSVHVFYGPYLQKTRPFPQNFLHAYQMIGAVGVARLLATRIIRQVNPLPAADELRDWERKAAAAGIGSTCVDNLNSPDTAAAIAAFGADLGVVAGTYILKPTTFDCPRLGSINLHSGKVPEYRGSAPAFWELYNGETVVGITIHRVVQKLDAGVVIRQELFPLVWVPGTEPMTFIEDYRAHVLRPNGIRMLCQSVAAYMADPNVGQPQDDSKAKVYPAPRNRDVVELERRLRHRTGGETR